MMDYGHQLYNTASAGRLKKLDSIRREGIRIYTGAFTISPVEALHVEANDTPLELRRNELGQRFMYKIKSNTSYIEILNTLDDREDQNYEENESSIKHTGNDSKRKQRLYNTKKTTVISIKPTLTNQRLQEGK